MSCRKGFTLIEIVLGMLVLLTVAMAVAPVFSQNLMVQEVMWDRKLAINVVETQLEKACNAAQTAAGFEATGADKTLEVKDPPAQLAPQDFPPELTGATGTRDVRCVDPVTFDVVACPAPPTLKRVQVTVTWTSRDRQMSEPSADYLISRIGACGTGA